MSNSFNRILHCLVLPAFALLASGEIGAQPDQLQSFLKARQVVESSLLTHGDQRAAESAGGFEVQLSGNYDLTTRLQGRSVFRDEPTAIKEHISWDADGGQVSYDADYFNYYSSNQKYRELYDDQGQMAYIDKLNASGGWLPFEMVPDARDRYLRVLPGMLLAEALDRPRSLRYEDHVAANGTQYDVVSFTTRAGDTLSLSIDRSTRLLNSASALIEMPLLGWTTMSWNWSEYRRGDSASMIPGRLIVKLDDRILKDVTLTTTFGEFPAAFQAPEGIEIGEPGDDLVRLADFVPYGQRPPEVETLAPRVYMVRNLRPGFGLIFVEFDDHVVAVDAPTGWYEMNQLPPMNWSHGDAIDALGRKYLTAINQTVPDKPVRFLILTHHHSDHIGGFMPFVGAGAKIIAGANAAHMVTGALDGHSASSDDQVVEIVNGRYSLADANMSLELIELPDGNPKADNYLMVYLPKQKLLYTTGFIYPIPESDFPPKESIPLSQYFVDWLDESNLEIEHIYNVHGMNRVEDWQLEKIRQLPANP